MTVAWDRLPASEPEACDVLEGEKSVLFWGKRPQQTQKPPGGTCWVRGCSGQIPNSWCMSPGWDVKDEVLQPGRVLVEPQQVYSEIATEMREEYKYC